MIADFNAKLEEIAEKVAVEMHGAIWPSDLVNIKSAMLAAIDEFAKLAWDEYVKGVALAYGIDPMVNFYFFGSVKSHEKIFRAMQAAQLKEIKEGK